MHEAELKHGFKRVFVRYDMGSMPGSEVVLIIAVIKLCIMG